MHFCLCTIGSVATILVFCGKNVENRKNVNFIGVFSASSILRKQISLFVTCNRIISILPSKFLIVFKNLFIAEESDEYPHYIWTWYTGSITKLLSSTLSITNKTISPEWKFRFLTPQNMSKYINTSTFPLEYSQLIPQHKADYVRLRLLSEYGGLWIDSFTRITSIGALTALYGSIINNSADSLAFCVVECPKRRIENGILYAKTNSLFIHCWLSEVEKMYSMGFSNYVRLLFRNGINIPSCIFRQYPIINFYFVHFACNQAVLQRILPRRVPLKILPASKFYYSIHTDCKQNVQCIAKAFSNKGNHISLLSGFANLKESFAFLTKGK